MGLAQDVFGQQAGARRTFHVTAPGRMHVSYTETPTTSPQGQSRPAAAAKFGAGM